MTEISNNKRIAKNTMLLYVRMLLTMVVSLYTSRVILKTLGIEDFGIYNVVAGVITMFSFLNSSMSGATSRFLAFELGKKNYLKLQKVFSSAMIIHFIIALCVLFLGETIGLWFLQNKLVIPENRMFAANIIYQITILSSFITILQVPYTALIMANEKMNIYAYVEILNVCLKLVIVYLLVIISADKLIVYGILLFIVTLLSFAIYRTYCVRKLRGTRFSFPSDKDELYFMLKFSGWDLYGNASVVARTQGVNMLLNIFFGAVLNAASGIATQVQSAVMGLAGNVIAAIRPQIVKSYAIKDYNRTVDLVNKSSAYTFMLLLVFTIPILLETDFVLSLWLQEVPLYSSIFCRYTLLFNLFANGSVIIVSAIHATGKIKRTSLINGTFYLLVIPVSYFAFKMGSSPQAAFFYNVIAVLCGFISNVWILHLYIPVFSFSHFFVHVFCKCILVFIAIIIPIYFFMSLIDDGWIRFISVILLSTLFILAATYFVIMDKAERAYLKVKLQRIKIKWIN